MKKSKKEAVSIYEYRCRRCNDVFTNTIEEIFEVLVIDMMNLNHLTNWEQEKELNKEMGEDRLSDKASLFEIHVCKDGGRGLSDLIGCEPPREVTVVKGSWRNKYREHYSKNYRETL